MLKSFIEQICDRSPLQRKALQPLVDEADEQYWKRGNDLLQRFARYLQSLGLTLDDAASRYLHLCQEIMTETVAFRRSGKYACRCQSDAYRDVYSSDQTMREYMIGLAITQLLWKNHYSIYSFFLDEISQRRESVRRYLEIGPGHGLYLAAAVTHLAAQAYQAIDISPVSLRMCREVLPFLVDDPPATLRLEERDALGIPAAETFDFITMGEVIEHLEDPRPVLRKVGEALRPGGVAFLTTCANCPTKDHIYLFRDAEEIRRLFHECGLEVERERSLRLHDTAPPRKGELMNYAALVRRAG